MEMGFSNLAKKHVSKKNICYQLMIICDPVTDSPIH
jgi:hypothetical protein